MSLVAALDYPLHTMPATALTPRLRVVLLGCGTVNAGVLAGLEAMEAQVEIAAIVTRKPRRRGDERYAWLTDLAAAFDTGPDLVIDGLPDCAAAEKALALAVERGIHVISANKAVIARRPDLEARARRAGTGFAYSAAVGGGVPVLETVARLKAAGETITRVRGVLNGTSNFVLGLLENGIGFDDAITAAQAAGFAEEDPSADLDGLDAAAKLALIARTAFDIAPDAHTIPADSLFDLSVGQILGAREHGLRYRQLAELVAGEDGVSASVRLIALPEDHPLARVENEENAVEIRCASGTTIVLNGKGAGQAPTAGSVLSDVRALLDRVGTR
ncbi:homoserine dehydrogenase [Maricaulis maris]|uniref:Homoserine dehydrogenase n=1 Tax=Maricaulis maris TaxID=74318 RepID=A0A495D309_9PROT|nr:homoserine dehydrogenase [Maricaulis maris]RKQ96124.1 homoserine dehydrogenase [Maricaulis maris]